MAESSSSSRYTLYYSPMSYYSQKVLVALYEKKVDFRKRYMDMLSNENAQAWFMRMNNNGTIPVLKDGEKVIKESEDIIDYIDREIYNDIRLVPSLETEEGREVAKFRKLLNAVPVPTITFGIFFNMDLSPNPENIPLPMRLTSKAIESRLSKAAENSRRLAEQHLDLRDDYRKKSIIMGERDQLCKNRSNVESVLNEFEKTCDSLEMQLKKLTITQSNETWLCGPNYTAADITLTVLLGRLNMLGLTERFFPKERRPNLWAYWCRTQCRPTTQQVVFGVQKEMLKNMLKMNATRGLAVLGGLALIGALVAFTIAKFR